MNALTTIPTQGLVYSAPQLQLIRRTVAKDCNDDEFNLFMEVARLAALDPFRRQLMALVFAKGSAEKRRMSLVTGIDGLRAIANRSGQYSPDDDEPDFTYDADAKDPLCNPLGLVRARVKVFKAGKPVIGVAYWDEFAPIKEENSEGYRMVDIPGEVWPDSGKPKQRRVANEGGQVVRKLDTSGQWAKMGRLMLAKCAEAQALRKGWPEDLSGLYEQSELDRAVTLEVTASEALEQFSAGERLARVGGPGVTFQFRPNQPLETIPVGRLGDRIASEVRDMGGSQMLAWFQSANQQGLREFWAHAPGDALEVKKLMESRAAELVEAEKDHTAEKGAAQEAALTSA